MSNEISDNEEIYKICPSSRAICRSIVVDIERLNLHSILKNKKREESSKEYAKNRVERKIFSRSICPFEAVTRRNGGKRGFD